MDPSFVCRNVCVILGQATVTVEAAAGSKVFHIFSLPKGRVISTVPTFCPSPDVETALCGLGKSTKTPKRVAGRGQNLSGKPILSPILVCNEASEHI